MLILTRKVGETVRIGENIEITLLAMNNQQAKLGIAAPKDVTVHREEIYQQIHIQQQDANQKENEPA